MRGYQSLPIRKQKPEFWHACVARPSEILATVNLSEGVSEMRIHFGPGYRVYFVRTGTTIFVLLTGGDKSSQKQDIARAKNMARELKETKT
jgi:hypothetical protein